MIQRIQSLYLLLGAIAVVLMYFFPFAGFEQGGVTVALSGTGLHAPDPSLVPECPSAIVPGIIAALMGVGFILTLFLYRKRRLQLRMLLVTMLLNLLLIAAVFIVAGRAGQAGQFEETLSYGVSTYLILVTIVLIVLANRGIRKDEAMVRAADRLR